MAVFLLQAIWVHAKFETRKITYIDLKKDALWLLTKGGSGWKSVGKKPTYKSVVCKMGSKSKEEFFVDRFFLLK